MPLIASGLAENASHFRHNSRPLRRPLIARGLAENAPHSWHIEFGPSKSGKVGRQTKERKLSVPFSSTALCWVIPRVDSVGGKRGQTTLSTATRERGGRYFTGGRQTVSAPLSFRFLRPRLPVPNQC